MNSHSRILIFGAAGDPTSVDALTAPSDAPHARARPILTDEVGVPYVRVIADSDATGTPLAQVPYGNFSATNLYGLPVVTFPTMWSGPTDNNLLPQKGATADNFDPAINIGPGAGVPMTVGRAEWSVTNAPAIGNRAQAGVGFVSNGKHVCTSVSATFCVAAADIATGGLLHLRDGVSGGGTILRSWRLVVMDAAGGVLQVDIAGFHICGSLNTDMTIEFAAAPGVSSFQSVGMSGYTVST